MKLILGQFQLLGQMNELQTIVVASFEVILENFCELMTFETRDLILEDWGASAVQSDDQSSTNQNVKTKTKQNQTTENFKTLCFFFFPSFLVNKNWSFRNDASDGNWISKESFSLFC